MLFMLNTCTVIKRSYFLSLQDLETRLKKLINAADVMLFMKGTPTEPRCGKLGGKNEQILGYCVYQKHFGRISKANSVNPDQTTPGSEAI